MQNPGLQHPVSQVEKATLLSVEVQNEIHSTLHRLYGFNLGFVLEKYSPDEIRSRVIEVLSIKNSQEEITSQVRIVLNNNSLQEITKNYHDYKTAVEDRNSRNNEFTDNTGAWSKSSSENL